MPSLASPRPLPYVSQQNNAIHRGIVTVTGTLTVDLGINHTRFLVTASVMGGIGATGLAPAHIVGWAPGTRAGTFVLTVAKRDAAFGDWILGTAAVPVSFIAIVESSVTPAT